jgi:NitT/TauT family transport system substrate-binding protein
VSGQPLPHIRIGAGLDEDFAEGFYGDEQGFFRQAGLDPDVTALANGGALTAAVLSGSLDVATTNTGSMAAAHARGIPLVLIAPQAIYSSASLTAAVLVMKDSPIRGARDLAGKKMGVTTLHTLYHTAIQNWIDASGGDSTAVGYVEIPLSVQLVALRSGRIDAIGSVEPWVSQAKAETRVIGKPYDSVAKEFLISGWVTTRAWVDANRDTCRRFVQAIARTAQWANRSPEATAQILARRFDIPPDVVATMQRTKMGTRLDPSLIQPVIDVAFKYKMLAQSFAAADLFDTDAMRGA